MVEGNIFDGGQSDNIIRWIYNWCEAISKIKHLSIKIRSWIYYTREDETWDQENSCGCIKKKRSWI